MSRQQQKPTGGWRLPCVLPEFALNQWRRDLACAYQQCMFDGLPEGGFRRNGDIVYRASCRDCGGCIPVRFDAGAFIPSKSQRRVVRINSDM